MNIIEIIRVFMRKSTWESILIILVVTCVISVSIILQSVADGLEKNIYDSFISIYPHIWIKKCPSASIDSVLSEVKDANLKGLAFESLYINIDEDEGFYPLYAPTEMDNIYLEALIANISTELDTVELTRKEKEDILQSLKKGEVRVADFDYRVLPGVLIGRELADKFTCRTTDNEYGRTVLNFKCNGKEQEYLVKGIIDSANPILAYLCLVDSLYNLSIDTVSERQEIFIQSGDLGKALDINIDYNGLLNEFEKRFGKQNVSVWNDQKNLKDIILLSQKVNSGLILISSMNRVLAFIALLSLVSLIIQKRRKEISIMLSMGFSHKYVFSIFCGMIVILFLIGLIISMVCILILGSSWDLIFSGIPFILNYHTVISIIPSNMIVVLMSSLVSYYIIAIFNRKLIIQIYRGE
ncbi:MAG: hypothetical protein K9N07_10215 [Candidatus Cloacimonetes bacterium]|nr:hypothetical protein [Candidatus Cloacimonadota bacterium]